MSEFVIVGAACIDNVVSVKKYPCPDEKIRSESSIICGGGNAGNTAMAITRLGVTSTLVSKIGNDSNGESIINEFSETCMRCDCIISSCNTPTAFTYVIVDMSSDTRTCIHTPLTEELTESDIDSIVLKITMPIKVLHFDSRHTLASCYFVNLLLGMPHGQHIITTIDLEKIRPHIFDLLPHIDIIFTNLKCVDEIFPNEDRSDMYRAAAFLEQSYCSRCSVVVCTLGSRGSLLLFREDSAQYHELWRRVREFHSPCLSPQLPHIPAFLPPLKEILFKSAHISDPLRQQYRKTYPLEMLCSQFSRSAPISEPQADNDSITYSAFWCSAWPVCSVIDSTGAGDAFIGGFLAGLFHGQSPEECLAVGSIVASLSLRGMGARTALPDHDTLTNIVAKYNN